MGHASWTRCPADQEDTLRPDESWDPLHHAASPVLHWSTDNAGEAAPGVQTPLSGTMWRAVGDSSGRAVAYRIGVLRRSERTPATEELRVIELFYGRVAMQMEYVATLGDRLPGTTGEDAVTGLLGKVPEGMEFHPTRRRYPVIAWRLPLAFAFSPGAVRRLAADTDAWWRRTVPRFETLDSEAASTLFAEASARFRTAMETHTLGLFSVVQPLYDALAKLVERTGVGDVGTLSGTGGAEMAIVGDIWKAAHARIELDEVIRNHGFHGPLEGELSSRVWREDPEPLQRIVGEYGGRGDDADPARREDELRAEADRQRRELLAALPRAQRPGARALLALAARRLPLRGVGKRAFLQTFDVARGAARAAGRSLADDGTLADPDDVFYLTADELLDGVPRDAADLVVRRRERRGEYQRLAIPHSWKGAADPEVDAGPAAADGPDTVEGIGVGPGVVEGTVRVVTDPGFAEVEPDEILVAPTTDPSWSSIMFVSAGLVVDIGGPLSHAAVVARELGLPCVVNTRTGSSVLRTGDRVRVDGSSGVVEVLERPTAGVAG